MEKIKLCSKNTASPLIRSTLVDNKIINRSEKDKIWKLNNGTGTNQIATEGEAVRIGGKGATLYPDKGCTYSRAITLGCKVSTASAGNQLVRYSSLSKSEFTFIIDNKTRYSGNIQILAKENLNTPLIMNIRATVVANGKTTGTNSESFMTVIKVSDGTIDGRVFTHSWNVFDALLILS